MAPAGQRPVLEIAARRAGPGIIEAQHGKPAMSGLAWIGTHEQRHQIGAHRMRDPSLVAVDLIDVALPHRPRLDRGEIGTAIGLGKYRGRQHFSRGELWQPAAFLFLGAAAGNQLRGDLGARPQRADPDVAA